MEIIPNYKLILYFDAAFSGSHILFFMKHVELYLHFNMLSVMHDYQKCIESTVSNDYHERRWKTDNITIFRKYCLLVCDPS